MVPSNLARISSGDKQRVVETKSSGDKEQFLLAYIFTAKGGVMNTCTVFLCGIGLSL